MANSLAGLKHEGRNSRILRRKSEIVHSYRKFGKITEDIRVIIQACAW